MTQQVNETSIYLYHSNQFIDLLNPKVEDIDIRDIAKSLTYTCRYRGHCRFYYSVAAHSILLCGFAPKELKLEALLDDAEEFGTGDITTPYARTLRKVTHLEYLQSYGAAKHKDKTKSVHNICKTRLKAIIAERFKLNSSKEVRKEIKSIENRLTLTEIQQLTNRPFPDYQDYIPFAGVKIPEWSFGECMEKFLTLYERYKRV